MIQKHSFEVLQLVSTKIKGHKSFHNPDSRWLKFVNFCSSEYANKDIENAKKQKIIDTVRNYDSSKIKL
jgi:hypothetical protein